MRPRPSEWRANCALAAFHAEAAFVAAAAEAAAAAAAGGAAAAPTEVAMAAPPEMGAAIRRLRCAVLAARGEVDAECS